MTCQNCVRCLAMRHSGACSCVATLHWFATCFAFWLTTDTNRNRFLSSSSAGCNLPGPSCASPPQQLSLLETLVATSCHSPRPTLCLTCRPELFFAFQNTVPFEPPLQPHPILFASGSVMLRSPMKAFPLFLDLFFVRALCRFPTGRGR